MVLARVFEDKIAALYRAGKIVGGVYLGRGQEAFSASLGMQLDRARGDVFCGLIRDQAGRMAFGEPLIDSARTYLGSAEGPMRGRDGNIHRGRPSKGMPAMISHLGAMIPVVNGMLMALRHRKAQGVAGGVTIGDGGTSTGAFHEALNQAAVEKLPLVLAVANNQYAYSTPVSEQFACDDLADRAAGYGVRGYSIDGTDLDACLSAFTEAIARARAGEGPQMVVGKLLRLAGHGEHDDARYIPESKRSEPHGGDCLALARAKILAEGRAGAEAVAEIEKSAQERVEEAVARAQSEPAPNPYRESWHALATKHLSEGTTEV
ncbi:MAG: thiamine pyrophosphate-dependent dehydrogenase E1 component subunit alpha [Verrucomicrobiae bacterium]|nr:thiamine pyrophosphate-dependent dehydrogenase E1 component subunit alpha [Verrucomicrobiae bacterium]MCP5540450.1 thiamine pyrophosphate-dependent dehydrogenase E1 component subunit alpha [Akkermansiaceae bacterium]